MSIWQKIRDGLSRDTWRSGSLGSEQHGRCLAGHVWYARMGTDGPEHLTGPEMDKGCADDFLVLHEIICEQYPDAVDRWLAYGNDNNGLGKAYPLSPYGLVAFVNDKLRYEAVERIIEKAAGNG